MVPSEMQEQTFEKEIIEATNGKADISWGDEWYYMQWLKENCKFFKIFSKNMLDIFISRSYIIAIVDGAKRSKTKQHIGLSPNGKATDSDSVISRFESL